MKTISEYLLSLREKRKCLKKSDVVRVFAFYVFAFAISLLSLVIVLEFDHGTQKIPPSLIFFPAVILSAWYGGLKPGILATIACAALMKFFLLTPYELFSAINLASMIQILLFLVEGISISFFIEVGKRQGNIKKYKTRERVYNTKILEFEKKFATMEEEIRSRDEFLSIASHELNTPLTSLLMQVQTALYNVRNVSFEHFSVQHLLKMLESTENQTKRLSRMINDLLNVSLITTGRMELELENADLSNIVKEALENFTERLEKENYELKLDADEEVKGLFDKLRIEQAISNLISNAIKYGNGNPIEVHVFKSKNTGKIVVVDQGIGMSNSDQKNIFGLFKRAVAAPEYKGLGVGLFITHQIVKAHNGKILVKSKRNKGSTFTVELPTGN